MHPVLSMHSNTDYNMKFYRDKMLVIIRNCDPSGKLVDLKLSQAKINEKPQILSETTMIAGL